VVELKDMQVVVLLGGLGTRLKSVESVMPKPLTDVHGKPFFSYQLELLKWHGFRDFVFCAGYKGNMIKDYFKDVAALNINIRYSFDSDKTPYNGEKLLGTGGALRKALPLLREDFMVIYGDSYMDINYQEIVLAYFRKNPDGKRKGLMTVFENNGRFDKSNIIFKNNQLIKYDKKNPLPEMHHIDYGVSVLNSTVVENIPENRFSDLADVYSKLTDDRLMSGFEVKNRFYEIGTPSSLNEFKKYIHDRLYTLKPAVFLDRDGTLNEIVYNDDTELLDSPLSPQQFKLLPNAMEALKKLKAMGYLLIVVTNQPAAAKGKVTLDRLYEINDFFLDILRQNGIVIDELLMCPHHPDFNERCEFGFLNRDCECRKPRPGLLLKAFEKFNIDMPNSYMAGDSHVDILAAHKAGVRSVFIGRYKCDICQLLGDIKPSYIFKDLYEFALYLENTF